MKLIKIISKNLRILLRTRSAASVVLVGPLLIMILAGLAFDHTAALDISLGIVNSQETQASQQFSEALEGQFSVQYFSSRASCLAAVQSGVLNACIEYPANFAITDGNTQQIDLYLDTSKTNLVNIIEIALFDIITQTSSNISLGLTTQLIDAIQNSKTSLSEQRTVLKTQSDAIQNQIDQLTSLQTQITGLDLNTPSFDLSSLQGLAGDLDSTASSLAREVNGIRSALDDLIDEIRDENITVLLNDADNAQNASAEARSEISSLSSTLESQRNQLVGSLDLADNQLDQIESQLNQAQQDRGAILGNVETSITQLTKIKSTLDTLLTQLDAVILQLTTLQSTDASTIVLPVEVNKQSLITQTKLNYILPHLMVMVIMFVGIVLASLIVIMEKHSPAQFRLFCTPTSPITYALATVLTVAIIMLVQVTIILAVVQFAFQVGLIGNVINNMVILLFCSFFFICLGMCVGYLFSTEQTGLIAALSISTIFLLLSDLLLPIQTMPQFMQRIVEFTPFNLAVEVVRQSMLFSGDVFAIPLKVGLLIGMTIVIFLGTVGLQMVAHKLYMIHRKHSNGKL